MCNDTLRLTDKEVLEHSHSLLEEQLPLEAEGYSCSTADLLNVLLGVAANRGTIESVCAELVGSPDADTIRTYFNEQLRVEDLPELCQCLNAALAREVPARLRRRPCDVAIDLHDRPYYGKQPQERALWVRGQAKEGTTRFYRVASAYVIVKHLRLTLAIRFVLPGEGLLSIVQELRERVGALGIRVARLLLDRGFGGIAVMDYLTREQQPALIGCIIRGKNGGTRALCQGPGSYCTHYTFHGDGGRSFRAELAVCRVMTTAKRSGHRKRQGDWMIFILIHLPCSPQQARRGYRRRFGIETSYRCAAQVRGWTTSPNCAYRFLLIGLSFVLLNVWVYLRFLFTQVPRRGGRYLASKLLPLSRLARFIVRALEQHYGSVHQIVAPATPRL